MSGGLRFLKIAAGQNHTCGITTAGRAYCWGASGTLGSGSGSGALVPVAVNSVLTFTDITAGLGHSCGVATGGNAYCWGSNLLGVLGDATIADGLVVTSPTLVNSPETLVSINAGDLFTCGVSTTGKTYCWGDARVAKITVTVRPPLAVSGGLTFRTSR